MTGVNDILEVLITKPDNTTVNVAPSMTGQMTLERGNRPDLMDELEPGSLAFDLLGSTYSPATNSDIRPRRKIQVRGKDHTNTFQTLWTGSLERPTVTYRKGAPPLTRFSAIDAMAYSARAKQQGPALHTGSTQRTMGWYLTEALADRSYGWEAGAATGTEDAAWTSAANDTPETGRTRMDLMTRIRGQFVTGADTMPAVWADRASQFGVKFRGPQQTPPTSFPTPASDQTSDATAGILYTQIDIGHSIGLFKNAVTFDMSNGTTDGPYVDGASVTDWQRQDITVPVLTAPGVPGTNAIRMLRTEPLPQTTVASITFNALTHRKVFPIDPIDQVITIKHAESGHNATYIITKETHEITPTSWFITYHVKPWATRTLSVVQNPVT